MVERVTDETGAVFAVCVPALVICFGRDDDVIVDAFRKGFSEEFHKSH